MDLKLTVIIAMSSIVALTVIVYGWMGIIAFKKSTKGTAKSYGLLFQRGNFLRLATVVLIVVAVVFLSLLDVIKENGVVGILSGIAGYVLGGLEKGNNDERLHKDEGQK